MGWIRRWPLWQLGVLLVGSAVAAAEFVARQWLPGSMAAAVVAAMGGIRQRIESAATAGIARDEGLDRGRVEHFAALRRGRFQRVEAITDHQAGVAETVQLRRAGRHDRMPPYVRRDHDPGLRSSLRAHRFILVMGETKAGKTRSAFEAVREQFPKHRFVRPASADGMSSLHALVDRARPCIVWLDDLEHYMRPGGLTRQILDDLFVWENVIVVATLRRELLNTFYPLDDPSEPARTRWREARSVLNAAVQVDVSAYWSAAERGRARSGGDPRLYSALRAPDHRVGLGLVAGHEQAQRWTAARYSTSHARAAAAVLAAVDAQRVGLYRTLPEHLLERAHAAYLPHTGSTVEAGYESWENALNWAQLPAEDAGCMLHLYSDGTVRAFDYLAEVLPVEPVPEEAWRTWLDAATPEEAFVIGQNAAAGLEYGRARRALSKAEAAGVDGASAALAVVTAEEGRPARALPVLHSRAEELRQRYGSDDVSVLRAEYDLALYTGEAGDAARAAALFASLLPRCRQLLAAEHDLALDVRHQLATFTGEASDAPTAAAQFTDLVEDLKTMRGTHDQRTLSARHQEAKFIGVQEGRKNKERAASLYRQLADDCAQTFGPTHPETLTNRHQHAAHTAAAGNTAAAAQLFDDLLPTYAAVFGTDHPATLWTRLQCALYPPLSAPAATIRLRQVLTDFVRVQGPEDPDTLQVEFELALAQLREGTPAGEITVRLRDVLSRQESVLNPGHPALGRTRAALARLEPPAAL